MTMNVTSRTRLVALLGNPVAHSASPRFQNVAFRAAGVDAVYLALRCDAENLPGVLRGIALSGGGGNVTVPHKEVAAGAIDEASEAVRRTGACNTYWSEDGRVHGDNTDVYGSVCSIRAVLNGSAAGARVLLVGGGGAASAGLAALADEGASEVVLMNRTVARAEALAERFAGAGMRLIVCGGEDELPDGQFDLAVNATSLGLHAGDTLPTSERLTPRIGAAFDMTYRGGGTDWTTGLAAAGIPVVDGREMLLWQGIASFQRWWTVPAPAEVMRAEIFGAALGEESGARSK